MGGGGGGVGGGGGWKYRLSRKRKKQLQIYTSFTFPDRQIADSPIYTENDYVRYE